MLSKPQQNTLCTGDLNKVHGQVTTILLSVTMLFEKQNQDEIKKSKKGEEGVLERFLNTRFDRKMNSCFMSKVEVPRIKVDC